jgi:hypothetical protein
MPKNLNRAEQSVKSTLEDYFENIASDVSEAGGTISIIPGQSDFHLDDGQAFINFQISATNTAAIEEVLLEYDYILDRSDDPNVVDFDFNEQATSSESYEIFQTNKIFNGNTPYYGKNAEGNTLLFATAPGPDGSFNSQTGVTTDDFTLLYYQGNYSLFDL